MKWIRFEILDSDDIVKFSEKLHVFIDFPFLGLL